MTTKLRLLVFIICLSNLVQAQVLKVNQYILNPLGGKEFATSLASSNLSLEDRESVIYQQFVNGNIPDFLIQLKKVSHTENIEGKDYTVTFFVVPDYLAVGNTSDFFYMPMTPILAQKVATLYKCTLPTKKIVDLIYQNASIKLEPQPIPPSSAMTSITIFLDHNELVNTQLKVFKEQHERSELTAGHKKDIIISNKIYTETTPKVVIYGWHKMDGKPIQPVYNKHTNTWADYSHGIRLVQNLAYINGKKTTIAKILADKKLAQLLSDEGQIKKSFYPITAYSLTP